MSHIELSDRTQPQSIEDFNKLAADPEKHAEFMEALQSQEVSDEDNTSDRLVIAELIRTVLEESSNGRYLDVPGQVHRLMREDPNHTDLLKRARHAQGEKACEAAQRDLGRYYLGVVATLAVGKWPKENN